MANNILDHIIANQLSLFGKTFNQNSLILEIRKIVLPRMIQFVKARTFLLEELLKPYLEISQPKDLPKAFSDLLNESKWINNKYYIKFDDDDFDISLLQEYNLNDAKDDFIKKIKHIVDKEIADILIGVCPNAPDKLKKYLKTFLKKLKKKISFFEALENKLFPKMPHVLNQSNVHLSLKIELEQIDIDNEIAFFDNELLTLVQSKVQKCLESDTALNKLVSSNQRIHQLNEMVKQFITSGELGKLNLIMSIRKHPVQVFIECQIPILTAFNNLLDVYIEGLRDLLEPYENMSDDENERDNLLIPINNIGGFLEKSQVDDFYEALCSSVNKEFEAQETRWLNLFFESWFLNPSFYFPTESVECTFRELSELNDALSQLNYHLSTQLRKFNKITSKINSEHNLVAGYLKQHLKAINDYESIASILSIIANMNHSSLPKPLLEFYQKISKHYQSLMTHMVSSRIKPIKDDNVSMSAYESAMQLIRNQKNDLEEKKDEIKRAIHQSWHDFVEDESQLELLFNFCVMHQPINQNLEIESIQYGVDVQENEEQTKLVKVLSYENLIRTALKNQQYAVILFLLSFEPQLSDKLYETCSDMDVVGFSSLLPLNEIDKLLNQQLVDECQIVYLDYLYERYIISRKLYWQSLRVNFCEQLLRKACQENKIELIKVLLNHRKNTNFSDLQKRLNQLSIRDKNIGLSNLPGMVRENDQVTILEKSISKVSTTACSKLQDANRCLVAISDITIAQILQESIVRNYQWEVITTLLAYGFISPDLLDQAVWTLMIHEELTGQAPEHLPESPDDKYAPVNSSLTLTQADQENNNTPILTALRLRLFRLADLLKLFNTYINDCKNLSPTASDRLVFIELKTKNDFTQYSRDFFKGVIQHLDSYLNQLESSAESIEYKLKERKSNRQAKRYLKKVDAIKGIQEIKNQLCYLVNRMSISGHNDHMSLYIEHALSQKLFKQYFPHFSKVKNEILRWNGNFRNHKKHKKAKEPYQPTIFQDNADHLATQIKTTRVTLFLETKQITETAYNDAVERKWNKYCKTLEDNLKEKEKEIQKREEAEQKVDIAECRLSERDALLNRIFSENPELRAKYSLPDESALVEQPRIIRGNSGQIGDQLRPINFASNPSSLHHYAQQSEMPASRLEPSQRFNV